MLEGMSEEQIGALYGDPEQMRQLAQHRDTTNETVAELLKNHPLLALGLIQTRKWRNRDLIVLSEACAQGALNGASEKALLEASFLLAIWSDARVRRDPGAYVPVIHGPFSRKGFEGLLKSCKSFEARKEILVRYAVVEGYSPAFPSGATGANEFEESLSPFNIEDKQAEFLAWVRNMPYHY
jgi:hypothetical protein